MTKEIFMALTIIFALTTLIYLIVCIKRQKRIDTLTPYRPGHIYTEEDGKEFIFVRFDAELIPEGSTHSVILFDILDKFWKDPAKELNNFYTAGNAFGIAVQIVDIKKIPKNGKFLFVIQDNTDLHCRYTLRTVYVPSNYSVEMYTGKH